MRRERVSTLFIGIVIVIVLPMLAGCKIPFLGKKRDPAPLTGEPAGDQELRKADQIKPEQGRTGLETRGASLRAALSYFRTALAEEQRKKKANKKTVDRIQSKIEGAQKGLILVEQLVIALDVEESEKKGDEERRTGDSVSADGSVNSLQEKRSRYQRALGAYRQAQARAQEGQPPDPVASDRLKRKMEAIERELSRDKGLIDTEIEANEREGDEASRKGDQIRAYRGCKDPSVLRESAERDIEALREKRRLYSAAISSYQAALHKEQLVGKPDPSRLQRLREKIAYVQQSLAVCDQEFLSSKSTVAGRPAAIPKPAPPGGARLVDDDLRMVGP